MHLHLVLKKHLHFLIKIYIILFHIIPDFTVIYLFIYLYIHSYIY